MSAKMIRSKAAQKNYRFTLAIVAIVLVAGRVFTQKKDAGL